MLYSKKDRKFRKLGYKKVMDEHRNIRYEKVEELGHDTYFNSNIRFLNDIKSVRIERISKNLSIEEIDAIYSYMKESGWIK